MSRKLAPIAVLVAALLSGGQSAADENFINFRAMTVELALEMAQAALKYCRAQGWQAAVAVVDRSGVPAELVEDRPVRVIDAELAYTLTDLLEGVLTRGTAHAAADLGFSGTAAGKTGTSDSLRDAWFVGYTPDILVAVWVGYDDNRPVGLSGAAAALPIWVDVMRRVGHRESGSFTRPRGIVNVWIDPTTGLRATRRCPERREEIFVRGTEPKQHCTLHDKNSDDSFGFFRGGHEPPR